MPFWMPEILVQYSYFSKSVSCISFRTIHLKNEQICIFALPPFCVFTGPQLEAVLIFPTGMECMSSQYSCKEYWNNLYQVKWIIPKYPVFFKEQNAGFSTQIHRVTNNWFKKRHVMLKRSFISGRPNFFFLLPRS